MFPIAVSHWLGGEIEEIESISRPGLLLILKCRLWWVKVVDSDCPPLPPPSLLGKQRVNPVTTSKATLPSKDTSFESKALLKILTVNTFLRTPALNIFQFQVHWVSRGSQWNLRMSSLLLDTIPRNLFIDFTTSQFHNSINIIP